MITIGIVLSAANACVLNVFPTILPHSMAIPSLDIIHFFLYFAVVYFSFLAKAVSYYQ